MNKRILGFLLILGLITIACGSKEQAKQSGTADFILPSIEGSEYSLSQFNGQVVVIDFWATWCPPCRNSIPAFIELYNKYHDQGFTILGISLDTDVQAVRNYSAQMKIPYPILMGNKDIARAYQVSGIPKTLFLDRKGKTRKIQVGFAPELEAQFDQFIRSLLEE
jgi:thiol-disulfide isomerase/thioredoxin